MDAQVNNTFSDRTLKPSTEHFHNPKIEHGSHNHFKVIRPNCNFLK